jgi:hypothetical protein
MATDHGFLGYFFLILVSWTFIVIYCIIRCSDCLGAFIYELIPLKLLHGMRGGLWCYSFIFSLALSRG